jgi:hypothetical protein
VVHSPFFPLNYSISRGRALLVSYSDCPADLGSIVSFDFLIDAAPSIARTPPSTPPCATLATDLATHETPLAIRGTLDDRGLVVVSL